MSSERVRSLSRRGMMCVCTCGTLTSGEKVLVIDRWIVYSVSILGREGKLNAHDWPAAEPSWIAMFKLCASYTASTTLPTFCTVRNRSATWRYHQTCDISRIPFSYPCTHLVCTQVLDAWNYPVRAYKYMAGQEGLEIDKREAVSGPIENLDSGWKLSFL